MKTPPDILCLYGARALRGFGDGFAILILPVYLTAIGFSPLEIGIVASASLLGTAALTLITGFIAPRFELRNLFFAGAGLIVLTGLIFPATETLAPVLLVAFVGSINPSGGDLGMLVPLEHALLTKETADRDRTGVFARYSLIGALDRRRRSAGRGAARVARIARLAKTRRHQADVLSLRRAGIAGGVALRAPAARPHPRGQAVRNPHSGPRAPSSSGSLPCSASMPSPAGWSFIPAGALAVSAFRPVARLVKPVRSSSGRAC